MGENTSKSKQIWLEQLLISATKLMLFLLLWNPTCRLPRETNNSQNDDFRNKWRIFLARRITHLVEWYAPAYVHAVSYQYYRKLSEDIEVSSEPSTPLLHAIYVEKSFGEFVCGNEKC